MAAFNGDGGAALYVSKALYICSPIATHYAHSADPDADFNAYWAGMTKAPSWIVDRARKDFRSCVGFIKGDAFDRAIADFSVAYADQNEKDYEAFAAAVKSGRLTAQTGL